jgi:predicted SnoaL-like aldol condensation-catalyzing enzyme
MSSIKGKVHAILAEQKGVSASGKEWAKIDFVIEEVDGQYPKKVSFTAMGEKMIPIVKSLSVGQLVEVHYNLDAREYNGKWFTNINAWRIDRYSEGITNKVEAVPVADDLPF